MNRGRLKLALLVALFVAPFLVADLAFRYWRPDKFTNYGELLETVEFRPEGLRGPGGEAFDAYALRGKWVFVLVADGDCDQACQHALYLMRQVRLAMGREQGRIARLVLLRGRLPEHLEEEYAGTLQASYVRLEALGGALAGPQAMGRIHLIDPYGRFVMRYPAAPDGTRMIRDVKRLLQYSRL